MSDHDDVVIEETSDEGDTGTPEQKLKALRDKLKASQKEAGDNLAGWQRAKADYVNLERRMRSVSEELGRMASKSVAEAFIEVADSLEAAAKADPHLVGVLKQMDEAFKKQGITRFTPKSGDAFDPVRHEPVKSIATETKTEDNTVSETLQSGYESEGAIIRPARVIVNHHG